MIAKMRGITVEVLRAYLRKQHIEKTVKIVTVKKVYDEKPLPYTPSDKAIGWYCARYADADHLAAKFLEYGARACYNTDDTFNVWALFAFDNNGQFEEKLFAKLKDDAPDAAANGNLYLITTIRKDTERFWPTGFAGELGRLLRSCNCKRNTKIGIVIEVINRPATKRDFLNRTGKSPKHVERSLRDLVRADVLEVTGRRGREKLYDLKRASFPSFYSALR